jgi:hypothetical protein
MPSGFVDVAYCSAKQKNTFTKKNIWQEKNYVTNKNPAKPCKNPAYELFVLEKWSCPTVLVKYPDIFVLL